MKKFIYILSILSLNFNLFSQESNLENIEEAALILPSLWPASENSNNSEKWNLSSWFDWRSHRIQIHDCS